MRFFTKGFVLILIAGFLFHVSCTTENQKMTDSTPRPDYVLVIHGGAGYITKDNISPEREKIYVEKLSEVLLLGDSILRSGGSSLDAVEACVMLMEDTPLFNAGKGAVFTEAGENEMDASIMNGADLNAGAVAGVKTIKNPIAAARSVMEDSKHVLLAGEGAEKFASEQGIEIVDPDYFFTKKSYKRLQKAQQKDDKHGTVGAVALDKYGNLAAATSTGGMTNKMTGRLGDSPIIGAGTYADNSTCAVSGTGHGEYFIRNVLAYDVAAMMKYKGMSLTEAANNVIHDKLEKQNAGGGIIAVDKDGNIAMPFNTQGMFRGFIESGQEPKVFLYPEEKIK